MKNLFLLLCGIAACAASGQKSYDNIEDFHPGDHSVYYNLTDMAAIMPGAAGENVTWDFSEIKTESGEMLTQKIVDAKDTDYKNVFPKANIAEMNSDGSWVFVEKSGDTSIVWGIISKEGLVIKNIAPYVFLKRPLKYGEVISGNSQREYELNGQLVKGVSKYATTADGIGRLKVANTTYSDVVRIKFSQ